MGNKKGLIAFFIISLVLASGFTVLSNGGVLPVAHAAGGGSGHDGGGADKAAVHQEKHGSQGGHDTHASQGGHHLESSSLITPADGWQGNLPLWIVLIPMIGALLAVARGKSDSARDKIVVGTCLLTLLMLVLMYAPVVNGVHINGQFFKGISSTYSFMPGFSFTFRVDAAALTVAYVTAFLWLLSGIYAIGYMTIEENRTRYDFFMLATLTANMGVLLAGDFLTLFVFFEGLILFPYALVAHKEDPGAIRGANMYLYLGVVGSLTLLLGISLFYKYTGSVAILPVAQGVAAALTPGKKYLLALLMIIGFGGKAGIFLEHIWLPNAHPVAPTPASALLSGAMIKAGAYGIFRVVCMLFVPPSFKVGEFVSQWATMSNIGYAVIWLGVVGMFLAVLSALITANSKRMLAFHSVSQMGYIVMGIGCAAYMGSHGAMGLAGSLYHIVNHALFKCTLFLGVGAVYFRTHELDMYKLGGLWRNMPIVAAGLFIAACGIAGIPGFNGFASKTLLHHAILEAYEHSALLGGGAKDFKLKIAEIIFMITAGGTFASNMKLFALTFLGKRQKKHEDVDPAPLAMRVAIILGSVAILFIGLRPNWMLENLIGPALANFNFDPGSHAYHLIYNTHIDGIRSTIPLLYTIGTSVPDALATVIHNLLGGGTAIMMGGMYFVLGMRFGWFHIEVPECCTLGYYYVRVYRLFCSFCKGPWAVLDSLVNMVGYMFAKLCRLFCCFCKGPCVVFDIWVDKFISLFMLYIWLPLADARGAIAKWDKYILPRAWIDRKPWQPVSGRIYLAVCSVFMVLDRTVVDGVVNAAGNTVGDIGASTTRTQTGFFQHYALTMIIGVLTITTLCMFVL